tara:strand:+ start:72 stop:584 length:513 start_codon:yes stop_codon:yes gene_type:complete
MTFCWVYRLFSKDKNIKETYIGSTTDPNRRFARHKRNVLKQQHIPVYKFISENGGICAWDMLLLEMCDKSQACLLEQMYIDKQTHSLNKIAAFITDQERKEKKKAASVEYCKIRYNCECGLKDITWKNRAKHNKTQKHIESIKNIDAIKKCSYEIEVLDPAGNYVTVVDC